MQQIKAQCAIIGLLLVSYCVACCEEEESNVMKLEEGSKPVVRKIEGRQKSHIYCFRGLNKHLVYNAWHSASLNLSHWDKDFQFFFGWNASSVRQQVGDGWFLLWIYKLFSPTSKPRINFDAFQPSYIRVDASESYNVNVVTRMEPLYILLTLLALLLFFKAKQCSQHLLFYYVCGISSFMIASVLILILVLNRFLPLHRGFYLLLVVGSGMTLSLVQYVWDHIQEILFVYKTWTCAYLFTAGLFGFGMVHWYGPPVDRPRTVNLVQWTLQFVSLAIILLVVQMPEVAWIMVLTLVMSKVWLRLFPSGLVRPLRFGLWYRVFPTKRRYLTRHECDSLCRETTQRALEELRTYCRSPDCNTWAVVNRLHSPKRFASFIETGSQLSNGEVSEWDSIAVHRPPLVGMADAVETEDEESSEDDDSSIEFGVITSTPSRQQSTPTDAGLGPQCGYATQY